MPLPYENALRASRRVLRALVVANTVYGVAIAGLLVLSFLFGIQPLHLGIGFVAARTRSQVQQLDLDWNFSITPWIVVLLLFVLARVFEHGARMRADLEGTV